MKENKDGLSKAFLKFLNRQMKKSLDELISEAYSLGYRQGAEDRKLKTRRDAKKASSSEER